ncbi:unnamed protein product [Prunus armeniaca]
MLRLLELQSILAMERLAKWGRTEISSVWTRLEVAGWTIDDLELYFKNLHECVGPSQISRPGAPGRGDVRQHVTSSFWMRCGCARACQHGLPCIEVMMRFE